MGQKLVEYAAKRHICAAIISELHISFIAYTTIRMYQGDVMLNYGNSGNGSRLSPQCP